MNDISNEKLAQILLEIGEYLEIEEIPFKPIAYKKAHDAILDLEEKVSDIYKNGGLKALEEISGVGISIAEKIEEFIKTGRISYYEELKKKIPIKLSDFSNIEGLGIKSIKYFYQKLGIKNLQDLEKALHSGKIAKLKGFGEKSQEKILKGIEFLKNNNGRFILGFIEPEIEAIKDRLANLNGVKKINIAGSIRRRKETVGDADILITSDKPKPIMDFFVNMKEVAGVIGHGQTKSSVKLFSGINVDLRVVPAISYGAALNYFTGSKSHNIALRLIAIKNGFKLNEYGLFSEKNGIEKMVAGKTEEEIYKKLGLDYIEPELRENLGEIELAKNHKLPKLIGYNDLKGDLQVQTDWSDGSESIEKMALRAIDKKLEYIAITDHTKSLSVANGLDEKRLIKQMTEIDRLNKKFKGKIKILKGTECDILKDGSLDISDSVLEKLDVVGIAVHSSFNLTQDDQTKRICRAMKNKNADILFHPTGRIINQRSAYNIDINTIIKTAVETKTIMEIDAFPSRLDLSDENVRKCVENGVKMAIDSDAHKSDHFDYLKYGISVARRGWAQKKDIINTLSLENMKKLLK